MQNKRLTSILVLMMSVIIMIGVFCLPASAATSIKKATITLKQTSYVYTGSAFKPAVTVKNGKTTLKKDTHYTVSYKNNKNVGKATVTITGKGAYNNKVTKYFYINPAPVTSLKAKAYAAKVTLTWKASKDATAYEIQQKNGSKWTTVGTTSKLTYNITGLSGATKYEFRVRATAKAGTKALNSTYVSVSAKTTLAKVTNISVSDVTESTATLKWGKVSGATSYRVTLTNINTDYKTNHTSATNSVNLTNLTPRGNYAVTVIALNGSSLKSDTSAVFNFSTSAGAVTNLKATANPDTTVNLSWTGVSDADGYRVSYSKFDASGNPGSFINKGVITADSYKISGLTPLSYYIFKVETATKTTSGSYTYGKAATSEKVLIPVTEVPGFTATADGSTIVLKWQRPSNIDGYKIFKNGSLVTTLEPSVTSYTVKGLTTGISYSIEICAHYNNTDGKRTSVDVFVGGNTVQGISITNKISSLPAGSYHNLSVKFTPDNITDKGVTYTSSNTNVATVGTSGVIYAKAAGTTTITATSTADPTKYDSFNLTVSAQSTVSVQSVSLKSEYTLYEGDIISLNPTFTPSNATNKQYTVTGADNGNYEFKKYIGITTSNLLDAKKAATDSSGNPVSFTVTVTTKDGSKTATTKVKVLPRMLYVQYNGTQAAPWYCGNSAKLSVGFNESIEGKYSLSDVRFKSDNTSVATVSSDGTVTCQGVGETVITAYIPGTSYSGDYKLYSRKGLYIADKFVDSCKINGTYSINAEIRPSADTDTLLYYSSDSTVATVDNSGRVTFKKAGSVVISIYISSDQSNPQQVWFTTNTFTAPSGSNAQLLNSMRDTANSIKNLQNLPSIDRYDETVTTNLTTTSSDISAQDIQNIFNNKLGAKSSYYDAVVSNSSNYTTLKSQFMSNVPVSGQTYIISPNLTVSDIQSITVNNNPNNHYYEMKLTLTEETMSALPASGASTKHGKVFDVLTSPHIDTYLNEINSSNKLKISYSSFTQRYNNSSLTLRINKATGNVEKATYDMNIAINIKTLKLTYITTDLVDWFNKTYSLDVSFNCNNIVIIDFADYQ